MRIAGAALSALGHAALLALAVWALPWLRVRPEPPLPVVAVSFVSDAELAELSRRAAEKASPPAPTPAPAAKPKPTVLGPRFLPPAEPEPVAPPPAPENFDLAPAFDAASPLGLPAAEGATLPPTPTPPPAAEPEEPDPLVDMAAPDLGTLRERHMQALAAAVRRARVYPPAAKGRGLMGTAGLYLEVARDGRLLDVRLVASSGSATLDRAAVAAARRARLPAAPEDLPGASFAFMQDLAFEAR